MQLSRIDDTRHYLQKIAEYISKFGICGVEDQDHLLNSLQSLYVNSRNLYNDLYQVRREEIFCLKTSDKIYNNT
jgi:hypothetical protein